MYNHEDEYPVATKVWPAVIVGLALVCWAILIVGGLLLGGKLP